MKSELLVFRQPVTHSTCALSARAQRRLLSVPGEPLFVADWDRPLMIHYEVDPVALQRVVPFELDLWDGRAFVSVVAFTLRRMRSSRGGRLTEWLLKPIATHEFLNVRTYVRQRTEVGIYFLAEWLSNRLSVAMGPAIFGLPYRLGSLEYHHPENCAELQPTLTGQVADSASGGVFAYHGVLDSRSEFTECDSGSLCEWLMERYTAFTYVGRTARFFRVWHRPWRQVPARVEVINHSLLEANWPLFASAHLVGANFSFGLRDVWMGRPHRLFLR